ncbi:MAG TPA: 4-hydroxy-tetrahydrodipicolinate reductase [Candidatus Syntrophosphaera sp.]|nr:4-hydroxy-tetrahydrodipicolinate reductase [Candidatus Syntrophosphaera sp.]
MLSITLIGYGKMGHMLASMAEAHGCRIQSIVDPTQQDCAASVTEADLGDVCLEFSQPDAALANIRQVAAAGKHLVVGTTGWQQQLPEVEQLVAKHKIGLLYGANFSIGMNLFNRIVRYAAEICDKFPAYDVAGWELHHNQKADSPSGTALQLARTLIEAQGAKQKPVYDKLDRRISPEDLHFASVRVGHVPGTHTVLFDSETDSLELTHRVRSRACFAAGALQAAQWISLRKGVYTFNQMMEDLLC